MRPFQWLRKNPDMNSRYKYGEWSERKLKFTDQMAPALTRLELSLPTATLRL